MKEESAKLEMHHECREDVKMRRWHEIIQIADEWCWWRLGGGVIYSVRGDTTPQPDTGGQTRHFHNQWRCV